MHVLGLRISILLALSACSAGRAAVPEPFLTGKDPRFGADRYIVGVGRAQTLEGARQRAVVDIAGQVQSTIRSFDRISVRSESSWSSEGVRSHDLEQVDQRIQQDVAFSRPEWVRVIDTHSTGSEVFVLAVLDRQEATDALGAEVESGLAALRRELEHAAPEGDLPSLARSLSELRRNRAEVEKQRSLLAALQRRPLPVPPEYRAIDSLDDRLRERRQRTRIHLCLSSSSAEAESRVLGLLLETQLGALGLRTLPCTDETSEGSIRLEGRLAHSLSRVDQPGAYPYFCTVRGELRASDEATGNLGASSEPGTKAGGMGAEQACSASARHLATALARSLGLGPD